MNRKEFETFEKYRRRQLERDSEIHKNSSSHKGDAHKIKDLGLWRITFSLVVLAYLVWLVIINALMFLPAIGLFPDNALSAMEHFGDFMSTGDTHNLIHELVFAFIVGTAAVGLLFQLWKPLKNIAGQLIALIVWGVMILFAIITGNWVPQPLYIIFGGLTILATIFHPAGLGLLNWIRNAKINKAMLALVVVAALPFFVYISTNIGLQIAGSGGAGFFSHNPPYHGGNSETGQESQQDKPLENMRGMPTDSEEDHDEEHAAMGHYKNMAAFSFIIILVGLLASFRPSGWRIAAWIAGVLPILLGLSSVILPDAESSIGLGWGLAAIVWGLVFIAASYRVGAD